MSFFFFLFYCFGLWLQVDRNVGLVLDELENLGLDNTTVVAFIGDHGWQVRE